MGKGSFYGWILWKCVCISNKQIDSHACICIGDEWVAAALHA